MSGAQDPRTDPQLAAAGATNDFLAVYLTDCAAGRERSLADYQAMFPGCEAAIAAEFEALEAEADEVVMPTIPDVELEAVIGRGGQGTVYRGRQTYLDRAVAVKVLMPAFRHPQFVDRFRREARTLASLAHPNIVRCHQAGVTDDGQCYLVMELIDGENLRSWLDEQGALPADTALGLARDLAAALDHANQNGIVHRDVKPENVLLEPWADAPDPNFPWRPRLVDLGLARPQGLHNGPTLATPAGAVLGTPSTMAPEQYDAPDKVDHRADIYGLGCVLYHALCGHQAFGQKRVTEVMAAKAAPRGPDPREFVVGIPANVADLVQRMLAHDPADRPASYAALLAELTPPSKVHPAPRMTRGRRRGIFTVLAVAAVAVAASYWPGQKEPVVPAAPPGANGSEESSPAPWEPTDVVPLFADGKEPFADWQRPELSPGLRDESGAPGLNRTSAAFVSRPLPHDDFELSGKLEPWGKDVGGRREQLKQAGLRIVLTDGLAIEIALRPEPDGDYTGVLRWTGAGDDANHWRPEEPIAVAPTRTAPLERLSFRLLWANGDLTCTLGEGDTATTQRVRPTDRANGAVPAELVFFVEHGKFVLHDVQLWR